MSDEEFDPDLALRVLLAHDVRFIVIGGLAGTILGSASITFDLDVCYARDRENYERLAAALRELHARLRGVDPGLPFVVDEQALEAGDSFTLDTDAGPLDILATPAGTSGYADLRRGATECLVGDDLTVLVVSLDDLIRMKRAAGRPKDRLALENLGALREVLEEQA